MHYSKTLIQLIKNDPKRYDILKFISTLELELEDCWIAAGFVRNLIWDYLHNLNSTLNDVDVIYYASSHCEKHHQKKILML
jgi:hypothetical protein